MGAILIAQPPALFPVDGAEEDTDMLGVGFALAGSLFATLVLLFTRILKSRGTYYLHTIFFYSWFGVLIGGIVSVTTSPNGIEHVSDKLESWPWVLGIVFLSVPGTFLVIFAAQYAPVGPASIIRSSDIAWGYVLQFLVFRDHLNLYTIIGCVLTLGSLWLIGYTKAVKLRREKEDDTLLRKGSVASSVADVYLEPINLDEEEDAAAFGFQSLKPSQI